MPRSYIKTGESLRSNGEPLVSPGGSHYAEIRTDGRLVVYRGRPGGAVQQIWISPEPAPPRPPGIAVLTLQHDGNLVLKHGDTGGQPPTPVWDTKTNRVGRGLMLIMQDDGNLVLYRGSSPDALGWHYWSSKGGHARPGVALSVTKAWPIDGVDKGRTTQALDVIVHQRRLYAAFGSWHVRHTNAHWNAFVHAANPLEKDYGWGHEVSEPPPQNPPMGNETAGVGLAAGSAGVLIAYEPTKADANGDRHGGVKVFGEALPSQGGPGYYSGKYFWQSVSVGGGFAIAAAMENAIQGQAQPFDIFWGRQDGGGDWDKLDLPSGLRGKHTLPHRQTFTGGQHLIFCAGYKGGEAMLIRVNESRRISWSSYSGLPGMAEGVATAEHVPGHDQLVAGTYSGEAPWRSGGQAFLGKLDPASGATSRWRALGGDAIADIRPLPRLAPGYFAVSVDSPARLLICDGELRTVAQVPLGNHGRVGGVVVWQGKLFVNVAANANGGGGAWLYELAFTRA